MTDKYENARANAKAWLQSIEEMLKACAEASTVSDNFEAAEQAIYESVLSVCVRDGWHDVNISSEDGPEEYEILLSAGGPALRIWGKLGDHCEPSTAELQMQDWGVPWERYPAPEAMLLDFAQRFYFG